jgi:hypothetical protein
LRLPFRDIGAGRDEKFLPLFEIARVLVGLNHVASIIVNANHSVMGAAAVLRVIDCRAAAIQKRRARRLLSRRTLRA